MSVGQIVDQGMQVRFTHLGCFIEEEGRVIAQGRRNGRMFILDSSDGGTAMIAKGQKVESDIDLWYKRIGHVNYQRLQICNRNKWYSDCLNLVVGRHNFVKPASLGSNTDFLSPMSVTGPGTSSS